MLERVKKTGKATKKWIKRNIFVIAIIVFIAVFIQAIFFSGNGVVDSFVTVLAIICLMVMIKSRTTWKWFWIAVIIIILATLLFFFFFKFPILIGLIVFSFIALVFSFIKKLVLPVIVIAICAIVGFFVTQFAEGAAGTAGNMYSTAYFLNEAASMHIGTAVGGFIGFAFVGGFMMFLLYLFKPSSSKK